MKHTIILFLLFLALGVQAQQVKQVTIIDDLETPVSGEGTVQVSSDSKITELIGLVSPEMSASQKDYVKTNGYRIQVFMSNDPRTARGEISERGSQIKELFPEVAIYTGYTAPNWKLSVGDFLTKDEADVFRQKLKKAIPKFGKEMYIIQDKINIPTRNGK